MSVPAVPELDAMWERIVGDMPVSSRAWLRRTKPIAMHSNTMMLAVSDETTRERIETKLRTEIETKLSTVTGTRTYLAFVIDPSLQVETPDLEIAPPLPLIDEKVRHHRSANPNSDLKLNPRYTFESFVAGSSNRFAHAAAAAVAEQPGKSYNPLMIYGPSGLGKTHLLHAIGHYVRSYYENLRVRYVSTEELTNDFINAISDNRTAEFRRAYRDVDVLLVDDIQFLEAKIQTQEEFFHTFNTLHEGNKQVVICSDRQPSELQNIEDRLVSRFAWGLVTDIQPPDLETRIAILQKKALFREYEMPDEVIHFLAQHIPSNIRELEGALNRVIACAELSGEAITIEKTSVWLKDILRMDLKGPVTIEGIQAVVAENFGMNPDDLAGSKRTAEIALARQIAMYLCRELTDISLQRIGHAFRKKDHTTVIHAQRKIEQLIKSDPDVKRTVDNIRHKL